MSLDNLCYNIELLVFRKTPGIEIGIELALPARDFIPRPTPRPAHINETRAWRKRQNGSWCRKRHTPSVGPTFIIMKMSIQVNEGAI